MPTPSLQDQLSAIARFALCFKYSRDDLVIDRFGRKGVLMVKSTSKILVSGSCRASIPISMLINKMDDMCEGVDLLCLRKANKA